jgi:putative transposase
VGGAKLHACKGRRGSAGPLKRCVLAAVEKSRICPGCGAHGAADLGSICRECRRRLRHEAEIAARKDCEAKKAAAKMQGLPVPACSVTGIPTVSAFIPGEMGSAPTSGNGYDGWLWALGFIGGGAFLGMLRYKVVPEGGRVVEVPAQHSSQTCAVCGVVDAASRRSQDVFLCTACGHLDNADTNAARVLLARGMRALAVEATVTGCGGLAIGRPAKQQLRVARRGTRAGGGPKAPCLSKG